MAQPAEETAFESLIRYIQESRGVDFHFGNGFLKLASQAADVGSSHVDLPINYEGKPV